MRIDVHGCQLGYSDRESGLPHYKPTTFVTTLLTAEAMFRGCRCPGCPQHQPLEGSNKYGSRTAQASQWPDELNSMLLEAILEEALVEERVTSGLQEAFPSEVRPAPEVKATARKRRKGRQSTLAPQYNAPPVYLRPDRPQLPQLAGDGGELLPRPGDDEGHRAAQTSTLHPVLTMAESARREGG